MENENGEKHSEGGGKRLALLLIAGIGLVLLVAIRETTTRRNLARSHEAAQAEAVSTQRRPRGDEGPGMVRSAGAISAGPQTPAEVVSNKVTEFGRNRRELTYAFAARYGVTVPPEVQEFYEAVEAGNWERTTNLFTKLWKKKEAHEPGSEELIRLSAPLLETFGVAEAAHLWPPEKLLDYGNAVLGSLKPGTVYIGGTDPGRFIPTLLNETADPAERRVVITQNMLADGIYLDYFAFQYGDDLKPPTHEQSTEEFEAYKVDAQKRFEHDRDFPDEPKQVRNGELLSMKDGKLEVSGAPAVMDINERILNAFIKANPGLTFAMEESFPFKSLYGNAQPLGPIFEINAAAADGKQTLDPAKAQSAVDYWQKTASGLLNDPEAAKSDEVMKSYSHMANAQANYYSEIGLPQQAEQTFLIAKQVYPGNVEVATGLSDLYIRQGRTADGEKVLQDFARQFPDQKGKIDNWKIYHSLLPPSGQK